MQFSFKENLMGIYTVTDKTGNETDLDVSYGLKATETGWKITSYKINSSKKK